MLHDESVRSAFAELPGVRLCYEIAGDGDTVVLLHGGFLDGRMWDEHFRFFAHRFQTIRYDMRCAGKSVTVASTEPYMQYQDLYALLAMPNIERVTLVGLSLGARTAIDFSIAYPERVQKLVLVSLSISGFEFLDEWLHKHYAAMFKALSQKNLTDAVEEQLILWTDGPNRPAEQVKSDVRERIREMIIHSFPLTRLAPNAKDLEPPAIGRLSEIRVPALIILGEKDAPEIHMNGTLLQEQVVGTELVMMPDVGHTLVMEKPSEFNALVVRFLQG